VHVWDLKGKAGPTQSELIGGGWVQGVAFTRDGKTFAAGRADHALHLFDVTRDPSAGTPTIVQRLVCRGPVGQVASTAFSPDDQIVATTDW
jgi:WD40 repeat protein